ncbi:uncharacterized protein LOC122246823 [Penaeus japonicus]|uniref:uncharacterized protein LOC122246823 n=1 Tax=Penaeus japonicus TaxID=27405 RepID=UPI001C70EACA|nr:uncharacterized protein LOC122246823 [Penaeus japonicus]
MGDFNAKIGQGNEECVGKFRYGERNERGEDLINFAIAHNFKIMNTFFQKKITAFEVRLAIKEMKKGKAPGPDNITLDLISDADEPIHIIEKTNNYKIPVVVALVDYTKAFDSVETEEVMAALEEQGVVQVYISVLRHIYEHATSIIRLHADSEPFRLKRGVRQGYTSSPKLFTACFERAFQQLNWSEKGMKIDGEHLSHLRFADDIFICAPTKEQLQEMLVELIHASKSVGLHMNFNKTKVMCNKYIEQDEILKIENQQIEERAHERIMLGITWRDRKTAEWAKQKTKVKDILEIIRKLKWNWAGHVARMTKPMDITYNILETPGSCAQAPQPLAPQPLFPHLASQPE